MKIVIAFVIISFAILLLIGCNTVRKTVDTQKSTTDSVSVTKTESVLKAASDSTGTKTEYAGYNKETVYEYDTVYRVVKGDLVRVYVPRIVKVYENGSFTKRETAGKKSTESVVIRQVDSTSLIRTSESKAVEKKSSRMPIGLIITVGIVLLVLALLWSLFKK